METITHTAVCTGPECQATLECLFPQFKLTRQCDCVEPGAKVETVSARTEYFSEIVGRNIKCSNCDTLYLIEPADEVATTEPETTGPSTPFCCDALTEVSANTDVEINEDGMFIGGCCGGGCYIIANGKFCPFCGTALTPQIPTDRPT